MRLERRRNQASAGISTKRQVNHDATMTAISMVLRSSPMLLLGSLSYSIYMVHIFVQGRMINVGGLIERKLGLGLVGEITLRGDPATGFGVGSPWLGFAAMLAMLAAVIVASLVSWRFVEMPALAWFRRLAKGI